MVYCFQFFLAPCVLPINRDFLSLFPPPGPNHDYASASSTFLFILAFKCFLIS